MRSTAVAVFAVVLTACFVVLRASTNPTGLFSPAPAPSADPTQPTAVVERKSAATPTFGRDLPMGSEQPQAEIAEPEANPSTARPLMPPRGRGIGSPTDAQGLFDALADPDPAVQEVAARLLEAGGNPDLIPALWDQFFQHAESGGEEAIRILDVLEGLDQEVGQARAFLAYSDPVDRAALVAELRAQFPVPGE